MKQLLASIERLERCSLTQVIELLVMLEGQKPAVRLVISDYELPWLAEAAAAAGLHLVHARTRLQEVLNAASGDVFTVSCEWSDPRGGAFAAFLARDFAVAQWLADAESAAASSEEIGLGLGLPRCCVHAYHRLQAGEVWLASWLSQSGDGPFDAAANHLASFAAGIGPAGEYLPCSPTCVGTAQRACMGLSVGRRHGYEAILSHWQRWAECRIFVVEFTAFILAPPTGVPYHRIGEPRPELELALDDETTHALGCGVACKVPVQVPIGRLLEFRPINWGTDIHPIFGI